MRIYSYDPKKQRNVIAGEIIEDVFMKWVIRQKHFLKVAKGYAISDDVYQKIKEARVKKLVFIENKEKVLSIPFEEFDAHKHPWSHGHGKQYVISEKYLT